MTHKRKEARESDSRKELSQHVMRAEVRHPSSVLGRSVKESFLRMSHQYLERLLARPKAGPSPVSEALDGEEKKHGGFIEESAQ